jgi:hypothetical protein
MLRHSTVVPVPAGWTGDRAARRILVQKKATPATSAGRVATASRRRRTGRSPEQLSDRAHVRALPAAARPTQSCFHDSGYRSLRHCRYTDHALFGFARPKPTPRKSSVAWDSSCVTNSGWSCRPPRRAVTAEEAAPPSANRWARADAWRARRRLRHPPCVRHVMQSSLRTACLPQSKVTSGQMGASTPQSQSLLRNPATSRSPLPGKSRCLPISVNPSLAATTIWCESQPMEATQFLRGISQPR